MITYRARHNTVITGATEAVPMKLTPLPPVRCMKWLCQLFYDVPCETLVYFVVSRNGLFLTSFRILVEVVPAPVTHQLTPD